MQKNGLWRNGVVISAAAAVVTVTYLNYQATEKLSSFYKPVSQEGEKNIHNTVHIERILKEIESAESPSLEFLNVRFNKVLYGWENGEDSLRKLADLLGESIKGNGLNNVEKYKLVQSVNSSINELIQVELKEDKTHDLLSLAKRTRAFEDEIIFNCGEALEESLEEIIPLKNMEVVLLKVKMLSMRDEWLIYNRFEDKKESMVASKIDKVLASILEIVELEYKSLPPLKKLGETSSEPSKSGNGIFQNRIIWAINAQRVLRQQSVKDILSISNREKLENLSKDLSDFHLEVSKLQSRSYNLWAILTCRHALRMKSSSWGTILGKVDLKYVEPIVGNWCSESAAECVAAAKDDGTKLIMLRRYLSVKKVPLEAF